MLKTLILSLGVAIAPVVALAGPGCSSEGHSEANISCEAGSQWNADSQSCVPVASS